MIGYITLPERLEFEGYLEGSYTFCYGGGKILTVPGGEAKKTKYTLKNISGESVTFSGGEEDIEEVLKDFDAEVVAVEYVGEIVCCYAYSKKLDKEIEVGGDIINLQIAYSNDNLTVGTPIIFGGY